MLITSQGREEYRSRREIARISKMLHRRGFVAATDGNLSVRLRGGHILSTPTGVSKGAIRPADLVLVDISGQQLSGKRKPTSELGMHLAIYRLRPDVHAIVHAHPWAATGFASAGISLTDRMCSEIRSSLGRIPLAPYGTPGTVELVESLLPYIPNHDAILMANHGVVTYGPNLFRAYMNMELVEHASRIALVARQLAGCEILNSRVSDAHARRPADVLPQSDHSIAEHSVFNT
jgi:L-fuculose-phosphate aldolase